jgi:hypothetical protein
MGNRYSDIRRAGKLQPALDRYIQYLQGTLSRPSRVGTQGARGATQTVYVYPFGFDLAASQILSARVDPDHLTVLQSFVNAPTGAGVSTSIGANSTASISKFRAARVVLFRNQTRSVQVATSDITGLEYLKYNGDRYSCPFGRDDAASTADQYDVFQEIKSALLAVSGFEVNRVSLTRERLGY